MNLEKYIMYLLIKPFSEVFKALVSSGGMKCGNTVVQFCTY